MTSMTEQTDLSRRDLKRLTKEQEQAQRDAEKAAEAFADSPAGQARAAWQSGDRWLQVVIPMSAKRVGLGGSINMNSAGKGPLTSAADIAAIEVEGFDLFNASYVFEETGQVSRDKLLSSGQQTATLGRILGIYLFRRRVA